MLVSDWSSDVCSSDLPTVDYSTTKVGTYRWIATYNGDSNNNSVSSGCQAEQVTTRSEERRVGKDQTAGGAEEHGIKDSATVSGGFNPTGTVSFALYDVFYSS